MRLLVSSFMPNIVHKFWEGTWYLLYTICYSQAGHPPGSNPLRKGKVYCLVPLFRGMLMRFEVFLEPPGTCGLQSCAWYPQWKSLVPNLCTWGELDIYQWLYFVLTCSPRSLGWDALQQAMFTGTWIRSGVFRLGSSQLQVPGKPSMHISWLRLVSLSLRWAFLQALNLSGGVRFITWHLRCPFLGECWWSPRHFWNHWACRLQSYA